MGGGASGRNAGFVTCGSVEHFNRLVGKHGLAEATDIWRFSEKNIELLEEHIVQNESGSLSYEKKGCFSLATSESEFSELQKVADLMTELKIPTQIYSERDINKSLGSTGFIGGIKYLRDATVHPVLLLEKIKSKLKNTQIIEDCEVHGIEVGNDNNREVKSNRGSFESSLVVLALNAYSSTLKYEYFFDKIFPTRGQILLLEASSLFMAGPCYAHFYLDYFRQLPTGEVLVGGFRQLEKETEVGYSDHITPVIQRALQQFIGTHLPSLQGRRITHRWSGVMGFSKDGQPMIGSLPSDPQIYFLGGYTGHGMGLAFNSAKHLVDIIFGRDIPAWLSAKRF